METVSGIIKFVAGDISNFSSAATADFTSFILMGIIALFAIGATSLVLYKKQAMAGNSEGKSFNGAKFLTFFLSMIMVVALACTMFIGRAKPASADTSLNMDTVIGTVNTDGISYSESKITNNGSDDAYIEKVTLSKSDGVDDKDCTWTLKSGDITFFNGKANGTDATESKTLTIKAGQSIPITVMTDGLSVQDASALINIEVAVKVNQSYENATTVKTEATASINELAEETTTAIENNTSLTEVEKAAYLAEIQEAQSKTNEAIKAAETKQAVENAIESGKKAIEDIGKDAELQAAKDAAKASLSEYAALQKLAIDATEGISDDEKTAAKNQIDQALSDGNTAIDKATTTDEIYTVLTSAKTRMDIIVSKTNLLSKYNYYASQISALATLTPTKKTTYLGELKNIYNEGCAAIEKATTSEEATTLYDQYSEKLKEIYDKAAADITTTTITLNENGGTAGSKTSITATYGLAMTEISGEGELPTKEHYTFIGYFDDETGGTQYYTSEGKSATNWDKEDAAVTLYAHWVEKTYSVTYASSGQAGETGSVPAAETKKDGETKTITISDKGSLTNTNKSTITATVTFAGWNTAKNGSGTKYASGDSFTMPEDDVTLYAQWNFTYSLQGKSGTTISTQTMMETYTQQGTEYNKTKTYSGLVAYNAYIASTAYANWNDAQNFIKLLNDNQVGGYSSWRLFSNQQEAQAWHTATFGSLTTGKSFSDVFTLWSSYKDSKGKLYYWTSDSHTWYSTNTGTSGIYTGFVVLRGADSTEVAEAAQAEAATESATTKTAESVMSAEAATDTIAIASEASTSSEVIEAAAEAMEAETKAEEKTDTKAEEKPEVKEEEKTEAKVEDSGANDEAST